MSHNRASCPLPDLRDPVICTGCFPVSSALHVHYIAYLMAYSNHVSFVVDEVALELNFLHVHKEKPTRCNNVSKFYYSIFK